MNFGSTGEMAMSSVSAPLRGDYGGVQISLKDLADKLNSKQQEAVFLQWGPSLVIAGAGSGKTTVLTRRVAYLLSQLQQAPHSILAVTFTNKAAAEMRARLEKLVGTIVAKQLSIGTFHSICARLLRYDIESYISPEGFRWKSNFVIYDETESMSLIKEAIKKLNFDDKVFIPKEMRHAISAFKNDGKSSAQCARDAREYRDLRVSEIFTAYQQLLAKNNALDFDDLILTFTNLLAQNAEVRNKYRNRYKNLLVDEFQDTNQSQYRMIRLLSADEPFQSSAEERQRLWEGRSLMVVGDVDQSIYSWRKADFRIILGFQKDFKDSTMIKLEDNYRSNETILDAANSIIKNNSERIDKVLRCNRGKGDKIQCHAGSDEIDEAFFVVNELKRLKARGIALKKCAILYRTNSMSRAIEEILVRSHVPYTMAGGTRFYERAEIKDAISYLKLVYNGADGQAFLRCINNPRRGIGDTSLEKVSAFASQNGMTMLEAANRADSVGGLSAKAAKGLRDFALLVERWQNMTAALSVSDQLEMIMKQSGYLPKLEEEANSSKEEIAQDRVDNVKELLAVAKEFDSSADEPTLEAFLTRISLVSDLDAIKSGADAVTLMTLHSAKGLEFENVFLMGLEEGLFPHFRSFEAVPLLEEERRLMYVGVTRAEERLYLTWARRRSSFAGAGGTGTGNYTLVSRFLTEINPELLSGFEEPEAFYREPGVNNNGRGRGYEEGFGDKRSRFGDRENSSGGGYGSRSNGSGGYQEPSGYRDNDYSRGSGGSSGYGSGSSGGKYGSTTSGGSRYPQSNGAGSKGYTPAGQQRSGSTSPFVAGPSNSKPGPISSQQAKPRVLSRKTGDTTPQPIDPPVRDAIVNTNFEKLKSGDRVLHSKFGTGTVTQVIGDGDKELYQVEFATVSGQRVLDPRFAKLVKLD